MIVGHKQHLFMSAKDASTLLIKFGNREFRVSILLIIYLVGFTGYETKAVVDYCDKTQASRVVTKGETLAIDTVTNIVWPIKTYQDLSEVLE